MRSRVLVYGAGRVGQAVARAVAASGLPVVLAGRDLHRVEVAASSAGLPFATASTMVQSELDSLLRDAMVVVNTAGPLAGTSPSMIDAAVRNGTHYLDVANEPEALAAAFRRHRIARERGVCVIVGLGLGVAVSEAAATQALSLLPEARRLEVVFAPSGLGSPTVGVVHTMLQTLAHGPCAVADGHLVRHQPGWGVRRGRLGTAVPASLTPVFTGDLLALTRSQPVRDVIVYAPVQVPMPILSLPLLTFLLRSSFIRQIAVRFVAAASHGRTDTEVVRQSFVTATAISQDGTRAADATFTVPDISQLIVGLVAHALTLLGGGQPRPGVWTPCQAFGPGALLDFLRRYCSPDSSAAPPTTFDG